MASCKVCGCEIPDTHFNGRTRLYCTQHTTQNRDMIVPSGDAESSAVGITALTKLKHSALWDAVKHYGTHAAVAELLGISKSAFAKYLNLMDYPRVFGGRYAWTTEKADAFTSALLRLTGKTPDELWPEVLREKTWLSAKKTIETTRDIESHALLAYVQNKQTQTESQRRLETATAIDAALKTLSWREREIITRRFGIGCEPETLEPVAAALKITRERVRQIETKALRKLQHHTRSIPIGLAAGILKEEDYADAK